MDNRCKSCGGKIKYDINKKCGICESCGTRYQIDGSEKIDSKLFYYPFNFNEDKIKTNFDESFIVESVYEPYIYIQATGEITYSERGRKGWVTKIFSNDVMSPKSKYMLGSNYRVVEDYNLVDASPIENENVLKERINKDFGDDKLIKEIAGIKLVYKICRSGGMVDYESFSEKMVYVPIFYVKNIEGKVLYIVNGFTGKIIEEHWINPSRKLSRFFIEWVLPFLILIFIVLFLAALEVR